MKVFSLGDAPQSTKCTVRYRLSIQCSRIRDVQTEPWEATRSSEAMRRTAAFTRKPSCSETSASPRLAGIHVIYNPNEPQAAFKQNVTLQNVVLQLYGPDGTWRR